MASKTKLTKAELLALSSVKGVGIQSVKSLAETNISFDELISSTPEFLEKWIKGANRSEAIAGINALSGDIVKRFSLKIENLENKDIEVVTLWDQDYPDLYRILRNPPPLIYIRGNRALLNSPKSVAVVGTRNSSRQAHQLAVATAEEFSSRGYLIVSGLAEGIDTAGHLGALKNQGETAAILVDVEDIYPKANKKLAEDIVSSNGLLLSENFPGQAFGKAAFVSRDRLQSGLCVGVFAIESGVKGGTMHTARFAREQSRLLYCPDYSLVKDYSFNWDQYSGIQKLIDSGEARKYSAKDYNTINENLLNVREKLRSDLSQISLF